jgi:threonine aldolase
MRVTLPTSFASDNYAGVHSEVLAAIAEANTGHAAAYGDDPWTRRLQERMASLLGDVAVFPVFNGTGANVTGLSALLRPFDGVICADTAHVNVDECGAPERLTGAKLIDVPGREGKLTPALVERCLVGVGDQHRVQPRIVSITQATEVGTVYMPAEIRALADLCHDRGLFLHMDGSRIANAAVSLDAELADVTGRAGVDVLSFGGTKNGLLAAEAVVFFDQTLARDYLFLRKQAMQLSSKMRFVSAQLLALLEDDLWRRSARHANAMARRLADGVSAIDGVEIVHPVQANSVFARLPADVIEPLQQRHRFYVWEAGERIVRWMCSWDTAEADVDEFLASLRELISR